MNDLIWLLVSGRRCDCRILDWAFTYHSFRISTVRFGLKSSIRMPYIMHLQFSLIFNSANGLMYSAC